MWVSLFLLGAASVLAQGEPCAEQAPPVAGDLSEVLQSTPGVTGSPSSITTLRPDAFVDQGLREAVLSQALTAFEVAWKKGDTTLRRITVIDYSMPSSEKRLWVLDLETNEALWHLHVAHGKNSGGNTPSQFSNVNMSKASNLGLMRTAETYSGKHGYSLRLDGLEAGFNDNARQRAIVLHGADYATPSFVERHGRLGRSWGCPAVDAAVSRRLIDSIKGGSLVFGYFPSRRWLSGSSYLNP